jgi:hypothetical protein
MISRADDVFQASTPRLQPIPRMQPAPSDSAPPPRSTPRRWWLLVYVAAVLLVAVSAPALHAEVNRQLDASGARAQVGDPGMADLAVNIGIFLAVLVYMLVLALYLSLASMLDRHIFRPRLRINGRGPFGLFFIVAAACTLPVHVVTAAFSITAPKEHPLFYAWVLLVGAAAPFLLRAHWANLERSKKATLFGASLVLATASYVA